MIYLLNYYFYLLHPDVLSSTDFYISKKISYNLLLRIILKEFVTLINDERYL